MARPRRFNTLTQTFVRTDVGCFNAHHYRYAPAMSTFLVEWDRRGCPIRASASVIRADQLTTLKAFVVLGNESSGSDEITRQLQDYVKGRLLPYKYPRIVAYVNELPKTGSGKIDRQSLLKNELQQLRPSIP
jgi:hypothetical protein